MRSIELGLVHLIRNLGDDDGFAVFAESFNRSPGAHHEAAAAVRVGFENSAAAVDDGGGGEVGAFHDLQNLRQRGRGIVHQRDGRVDDLSQIVRRNFRRHADGDSIRAVHQQIRNARRQNVRLDFVAVVVGTEIDCVFIQIFEQRGSHARELGFGVTVGRRRISIHRAEISLPIHQRIAHRKRLRQAHQRVIHRKVSMRMVLAHDFADDAGALARGLVRLQAHLLHGVENAPMHGLQSVAHVGQRAADDHRHRIVEIRPPHLLFNVDRLNVAAPGRRRRAEESREVQDFDRLP